MENEDIFSTIMRLTESYKEFYNSTHLGKTDLQVFALWLHSKEISRKSDTSEDFYRNNLENLSLHGSIDDQISFMLLGLQRLIKFYVKKATEGTKLVSVDDIHFLLFLAHTDSMKKSELINLNITEMSSGIEVIKRLIKNGLIEDYDDPNDKRSKRVKITMEGKEEAMSITSTLDNIHQLLLKPIFEKEKFLLLSSLLKLYKFHINIFNKEKNTSLKEIVSSHLKY